MGAYIARRCWEHGDWNEDIDNPSNCPGCTAEGKTYRQRALYAAARVAELEAERDELIGQRERDTQAGLALIAASQAMRLELVDTRTKCDELDKVRAELQRISFASGNLALSKDWPVDAARAVTALVVVRDELIEVLRDNLDSMRAAIDQHAINAPHIPGNGSPIRLALMDSIVLSRDVLTKHTVQKEQP